MKLYEREALRQHDMDVVGGLFALRFVPETNQVELYIEDDEWFHFKASFNTVWLADLGYVAAEGKAAMVGEGAAPSASCHADNQ